VALAIVFVPFFCGSCLSTNVLIGKGFSLKKRATATTLSIATHARPALTPPPFGLFSTFPGQAVFFPHHDHEGVGFLPCLCIKQEFFFPRPFLRDWLSFFLPRAFFIGTVVSPFWLRGLNPLYAPGGFVRSFLRLPFSLSHEGSPPNIRFCSPCHFYFMVAVTLPCLQPHTLYGLTQAAHRVLVLFPPQSQGKKT